MIFIDITQDTLCLRADEAELLPRHENQLAYWKLRRHGHEGLYTVKTVEVAELLAKITSFLVRSGLEYQLGPEAQTSIVRQQKGKAELSIALQRAAALKEGTVDIDEAAEFLSFLKSNVTRTLKEHQVKAALHFLAAQNGANFSVPGSGKTTVVLAVFQRLRYLGEIDALFVVGPPACFGPWATEYKEVLGVPPTYEILAGGDAEIRRTKYLVNRNNVLDLYLTTFQTLQRDWENVHVLFKQQGVRFLLVVDEAHYVKQLEGSWAKAVLRVSQNATRRCVLTGTPFPHSYRDAFNLFDILWPEGAPLSIESRNRIELHEQRKESRLAAEILNDAIGPLFYRVRKAELGLAPQEFHPPITIQMHHYERLVYDSILDRVRDLSQKEYFRDIDLLLRIRKGRMMRLRQCLSSVALLNTAVDEYTENLFGDDMSIADIITHYDDLEVPAKLDAIVTLIRELVGRGEKVVIWSNFIKTLERLRDAVSNLGYGVRLIYGATPVEGTHVSDELTREDIIREFVSADNGIDVLVANPAACAESISLHKTCSHAIYYDLSYNCAQYLQSLDRIHRVGGSENKPAHYHFLQYQDTFEADILHNVRVKTDKMNAIIDQEYAIYSLDMFEDDGDVVAYERLFGDNREPI